MSACTPLVSPRAQLAFHLRQTELALGPTLDAPVYLRYAVGADGSRWTYEIVLGPGSYAERRTRRGGQGGETDAYAFGLEDDRAWLQTGDRLPVVVDGSWATEARSNAAFFGLRFLRPAPGDHAELLDTGGRSRARWTLSFPADGGRTHEIAMDRRTNLPVSDSTVDDLNRVSVCDGIAWRQVEGRAVIESMRCSSIAGYVGRVETTFVLESTSPEVPEWGLPTVVVELPRLVHPSVTRIDDPMRIHVPVTPPDGGTPRSLLLDSGSPWTIVNAETASALGVIRTGAPLVHAKPPWLPDASYWVGVLDRLRLGDAEIHGATVLVADDPSALGGEQGLIGTDVFRRFVVDVDSPAGVLRLHDPARFRPSRGDTPIPVWGTSIGMVTVHGEVLGVDEGKIVLDTGAPLDIVVTAWQMASAHPRHNGDSVQLGVEGEVSPEYLSRIDGLWLGPFEFPAMDVFARDRDKHGNINTSGAVALVGMGLMRHLRLAFDLKNAQIHAWPGPSYYRQRWGH